MFIIGTTIKICDFRFDDANSGGHGANVTSELAPKTVQAVEISDIQNMTFMDSCNITINTSLKTVMIRKLKTLNNDLNLSNKKIACVPEDLFHSAAVINLEALNLGNNQISDLPEKLIHGPYLKSLVEINLSFNQISHIPPKFFFNQALAKLQKIYLNNNRLNILQTDTIPRYLYSLFRLDLSHNNISAIGNLVVNVLEHCEGPYKYDECGLDLSHNQLTVQETYFIMDSGTNMIYGNLDVSYNSINKFRVIPSSVYEEQMYVIVPLKPSWIITSGNKDFSVVNLVKAALDIDISFINQSKLADITERGILRLHTLTRAFPFLYNCNCDMLKYLTLQTLDAFKQGMITYENYEVFLSRYLSYAENDLKPRFNYLKCGSPEHLYGRYLESLNKTDLQCENTLCTEKYQCICTETPANSTLRIKCTPAKRQSVLLLKHSFNTLEIYIGSNFINIFPEDNVETLKVTVLDLSHNRIKNIPTRIFSQYPRLRVLNMVGNQLMEIPTYEKWSMMQSLQVLQLAGNQFPCNCPGLEIKNTLTSLIAENIIEDIHNTKCFLPPKLKDKVIYKLPNSEFGCPFIDLVLTLTLTLSFLLFFLALAFVAYVFRYYVRLFLFIHFGWRFFYNYTKDETVYDIFISYSSKDSDWVIDRLVNPLESLNPPYNLCLHERDFLIGVSISDNMEKAIEGSKCTLCVVSNNWLKSDWCQFEFRVAHCVATVEKQSRLLVILKEEIPKTKIKGDLKYYIKTFTYLDSAHPLFWSRLLNDLPRPDVEAKRDEHENRDIIELT